MYHISAMKRKNFKCIYNYKISTKKWIKWMNTTETVTGKVPQKLNFKERKELGGQL